MKAEEEFCEQAFTQHHVLPVQTGGAYVDDDDEVGEYAQEQEPSSSSTDRPAVADPYQVGCIIR